MKGGTSSPTTTSQWVLLQIIYLCHEACILLPHFLVSALKCLLKVWERAYQELVSASTRYQNANNFILVTANCKSLWSLCQSNWHTFLYISVSEDSRLQLMVRFTLWRIILIRKRTFTCSPAQFGWKPSLCNISWMRRNREVCASCRGQK